MTKKLLLFSVILLSNIIAVNSQTFTWNPPSFDEDENVTLTVSNFDPENEWDVSDIYLWAWHFDSNGVQINNPTATGNNFSNSPETAKFTDNMDGTYTYDFGRPQDFFDNTGISEIGYLIKSQDGTNQSGDSFQLVGRIRVDITSTSDDVIIVENGGTVNVSAVIVEGGSTTVEGTFDVFYNDVFQNSGTCGFPTCSIEVTNIMEDGVIRIVGTPPDSMDSAEASINVKVISAVIEEALPTDLVDGINYDEDATRATLVIDAPGKEFVEIAGSWNNFNPSSSDVMKRDPDTGKYWLELTGLTPGQVETYQYWVYDTDPIANSLSFVKVADPYSTLVLDSFDAIDIPASNFPNLPTYPAGQEGTVTILETGQTPYDWQVPNFQKPKIEDLIVYEVLLRDFDVNQSYQDLIDRIDYFKDLNINAIHLMPVMQFKNKGSWGYDPTFHMALEKLYGTPDKLKEFVDLCHQNGIAIILDVVLNHAEFPNPLVKMWRNENNFRAALDSPYFNELPTHSFNVFYDFNHQQPLTQEYTKRVIKHWIEEFKIDGFRWDLTKGFTQNCGNGTFDGDFGCTQQTNQDRVDVLKEYADYSWSIDDTHYVIFEHLGGDSEEQQWANHRIDEGKGIMLWGKMTNEYNQLTMGYNSDNNINRMGHVSRGFDEPRLLGYPESHDEERLMYKNVAFGNSSNGAHDVKDLNTGLSRMSALGAVSVLIPGPKMIWHFGALGMENSIFTCNDGSVDDQPENVDGDGDCKLDTKPQPQWTENWLGDSNRRQIYDDWAKMHALKINEPVFEGDYSINSGSLTPRIYVFDNDIPANDLRNVVIIANFDVVSQNIVPDFPYTGTWYDLMDENGTTSINVSNTASPINLQPGEFRVYGNQPSDALSINEFESKNLTLYPNPVITSFYLSENVSSVKIFDLTGKMIKSFKSSSRYGDELEYNISELNQGVYLVKAENELGAVKTSKLIKL